MRPMLIPILAAGLLSGCEKNPRPAPDNPPSSPSSTPTASTSAAPASSKEGPAPDDPMLANATPTPMPPAEQTKPLVAGSNAFAFDFWPRVARAPGNAAFSPASMSIAFAMAWPGAKGETAAQMKKVMHFGVEASENAKSWGAFSRAMTSPARPVKVRVANRLFGEKTYRFEQAFLDSTRDAFAAPMQEVDFKTAFEPSRLQINGWVSEKTEKRIEDLLPPGALDADTRIALVNALYFLADWEEPFEKSRTADAPFDVSGTKKKDVPTMHLATHMPLTRADGVKVVELDYRRGEASMVIVVPDKKDGLPAVERSITAAKLEGWRKAATNENVSLALPKWELTTPSLELGKELAAMGMSSAFDRDKADLTGIANPPSKPDRLFIAKVFHKAFVKVDEKGTEAAAATALLGGKGGGVPAPPTEVKVDHPFLYFIVDKPSGLVLFMGRVDDPTAR